MTTDVLQKKKEVKLQIAQKQQRQASDPDFSVWVEASAGTGKTKVLTDRVLRLLLRGVNPAKILCLTYTKAAAVEMAERIAKKLSFWTICDELVLLEELEKLFGYPPTEEQTSFARRLFAKTLELLKGMRIQTIHSFCQEVLKKFPFEANISPYFEVMDDRASSQALAEIKKQMFEDLYKQNNLKEADALGVLLSQLSEKQLLEVLGFITVNRIKITELLQKKDAEKLLVDLQEELNVDPLQTKEEVLKDFFARQNMQEICKSCVHINKITAQQLGKINQAPSKALKFSKLLDCLFKEKDGRRAINKTASTEDVLIINTLMQDCEQTIEHLKAMDLYAATSAVLLLANYMIKAYADFKQQNTKYDYEDLIVITKNLLENKSVKDWVLYKLDDGIDHILIDEAQDTSPLQWSIVSSLTDNFFAEENSGKTLFVVGDRKQSIYSFQGADINVFENMRQKFLKHKSFQEVKLDISFRSVSAVMDVVNHVFNGENMQQAVGQQVFHDPAREGEAGRVELWKIPTKEELLFTHKTVFLARKIVAKIKKMVAEKEMLQSQGRPVTFGDFLVLVRTRGDFADNFIKECKSQNVPVSGADRLFVMKEVAVKDLMCLANFLLLPQDDLNLATLLKSPLFGLNDDDLFELCYKRYPLSLWQRLSHNERFKNTYKELQQLLDMTDFVRPYELFSFVLINMRGKQKFVERLGFECLDAIEEFLNLALQFEKENPPSLQKFVEWAKGGDLQIKRDMDGGNNNFVRIMTVHASKGLQAPIVILPDTTSFPSSSKIKRMLWDKDLFYVPLSAAQYEKTTTDLLKKLAQNEHQEYLRLLYVAMTRAEDRLCICAHSQEKATSWYDFCKKSLLKIGSETLDGELVCDCEQQKEVKESAIKKKTVAQEDVPDWLFVEPEKQPTKVVVINPSVVDDEDVAVSPREQNIYLRGNAIHKLLQTIGSVKKESRPRFIKEFLSKQLPEVTQKVVMKIAEDVEELLNKYGFLFGDNSRAEMPVVGELDDKIVMGQIDRVVFQENKIIIIDYKTNREAAQTINDVPKKYIKQMNLYSQLVEKMFPDKKIEAYILWVASCDLMKIF